MRIQTTPSPSDDQDPRTSGNGGDSPFRKGTPASKGDGRFPRSSETPEPAPLDVVAKRLFGLHRDKELRALITCGTSATLFECPDHHVWVPRFCQRAYCPKCGREGSPAHKRKYARLVESIMGVRVQKDVVTLPAESRPTSKAALREFMQAVADLTMVWYGVDAAKIVVHWLGEKTQGVHLEVLTPDLGKKRSKQELYCFREWLSWGLGQEKLIVVNHQFISDREPLERQQKKWWHMSRYATHATAYTHRWKDITDAALETMLEMMGGFHTVRGYGLWSPGKVNSKEAKDLAKKFPINVGDEMKLESGVTVIGKVKDGGECPVCQGTLRRNTAWKNPRIPACAREVVDGIFVTDRHYAARGDPPEAEENAA